MENGIARQIGGHLAKQLAAQEGGSTETLTGILLRQVAVLAEPEAGAIWLPKSQATAHWLVGATDIRPAYIFSASVSAPERPGQPLPEVSVSARPLLLEAWIVNLVVRYVPRNQQDRFETSWSFEYGGDQFLTVEGEREVTGPFEEWSDDQAERFARLLAAKLNWPIDEEWLSPPTPK